MSANVLHCSDSFAFLRAFAERRAIVAHVTITDPPYDAHNQANQMSGTTLEKVDPKFEPLADYLFTRDLVSVSERWALTFCTVEGLGAIRDVDPKAYKRGAIWYKYNSMGQLTGDRPAAAFEGVACLHGTKAKQRWNGRGSFGFWACAGTRGEKERHPNQKPLPLLLKLVALFSDRGETIFDPFAGSGRIGEAAILLGRNYIGLERDPVWVERAWARLALAREAPGVTDAEALAMCSAKKLEILAEESGGAP